jgi:glutaredoxin 3
MYTQEWCGYCRRAKSLLDRKNLAFREISLDEDPKVREEMIHRSGRRTVPQIFIGDRHIGGFAELDALERDGSLDRIIEELQ